MAPSRLRGLHMDEADVLADMFGRRRVPEPVPVVASAAPDKATTNSGHKRHALALALSLVSVAIWLALTNFFIGRMVAADAVTDPVLFEAVVTAVVFGGLIGIALVCGRLVWVTRPMARIGAALAIPMGFAVGICGLSYAVAAAWLGGHVVAPEEGVASAGAVAFVVGTLLVLLQTAAEEAFFRGWFQPVIAQSWGPAAGIGVASLVFALLHVFGRARSPLSILNLCLAGVLFGLLALRTGGLAAPIAAHFGWNWAEEMLFGLDPNPGVGTFGTLTDHDLAGSAFWGGSTEGLNASVAISFALLALIVPLIAWRRPARVAQPT